MDDRRVFARFPVNFPLRFLNLEQSKEGEAVTFDISAKGIGIVADKELPVHSDVELWLKVPDNKEPFYTRGEVVWSKMLDTNKCRAGINLERADFMGISRVLRAAK